MKKITYLLFVFSCLSFSQSSNSDITARIGIGYDTGLNINLGVGFVSGLDNEFGEGIVFTSSIGYELLTIDKQKFHGPDLNLFVAPFPDFLGFGFGVNTSYLKGDNKWMFNVIPEIGLTLAGILSIKYGYNISNIKGFFPEKYTRSSVSLIFNMPLNFLKN